MWVIPLRAKKALPVKQRRLDDMARSMHEGSFVTQRRMKQPSLHSDSSGSSQNTLSIVRLVS